MPKTILYIIIFVVSVCSLVLLNISSINKSERDKSSQIHLKANQCYDSNQNPNFQFIYIKENLYYLNNKLKECEKDNLDLLEICIKKANKIKDNKREK